MDRESIKSTNDPFDPIKVDREHIDYVCNNDDDLFDQPPATKMELWSYYLYYNGVRKLYTCVHTFYRKKNQHNKL